MELLLGQFKEEGSAKSSEDENEDIFWIIQTTFLSIQNVGVAQIVINLLLRGQHLFDFR